MSDISSPALTSHWGGSSRCSALETISHCWTRNPGDHCQADVECWHQEIEISWWHTVFKFTWYKLARLGKCSGGKALTWTSSWGDWGDSPGGRRGRRWRPRPRSRSRWGPWWRPPTRRSCPLYSVRRLFLKVMNMKSSLPATLVASNRQEDSERAACVLPWAFLTLSPPLMIIHKRWGFRKLQCTRAKLVAYTLNVYITHHNLSRIKSNKCFEKFRKFSIW